MKKIFTLFIQSVFLLFCNTGIFCVENSSDKILRLASSSDPKTFNLIVAQETSTTEAVGLLFEGLTRINGITTEPEPALSSSWTHTKDGLEWIFNLREDVKWFDGKNFTADDVVFTFNDLIFNEDIPCSARDIFTIEGKMFKVEKIDTYKVKITTPTPYAPLLNQLSQPILPKHILSESVKQRNFSEKWGINTLPQKLIGTGPFKLTEYLPGQRLVYEKNPNYWRKDNKGNTLPYIDRIVTYIVPNLDAQLLKFRAGEIDVVSIPGKDYALLKDESKIAEKNYTVYDCGPGFGTDFITFNLSPVYMDKIKLEWFSNPKFRKAIAFALDRESMINNILSGMGTPQYAAMNESAKLFYNPNVEKYDYNPKRAKKLLKKAGFIDTDSDGILEKPKGVPVKFTILTNAENNTRVDIGTIIQSDLKAIGLDVSLRPIDFNNLVTKLNYTHDWDSVLIGLTGGIEPHSGKNVWAIDGHLHIWNVKPEETTEKNQLQLNMDLKKWEESLTSWEKEVDALFNKGVQELIQEKRKEIYWQWQEITAENLPLIYTINPKALFALRNTLKNTHPTAYGGALHNIEELKIEN
jgi:peptide/nickel transport system substrate-binding protein